MFKITSPQSISEEVCESGMIDAAQDLWRQQLSPNWVELSGGCELVSGAITGWGSGTTGVTVSKDGTPDSAVLEWELFCKMSSTCRLQTRPSSRWTRQECDEGCCTTVPGWHFCPDKWSRARTVSPTAISLNLACLSWCIFIFSCWQETWVARSGLTRERRVRSSLCRNSLAGDEPVVLAGCFCKTKGNSGFSAAVCRMDQMLKILESAWRFAQTGQLDHLKMDDTGRPVSSGCHFVSRIPRTQQTEMVGRCH